ncbi:helix-turn-helix transcriptional regulator [Agrobacterium rhizogenes]|uniref:helix-turn-helix domain-containing protein n=1 Tax=Rhizobium rhizogenes TaxID=359 RepID=UPI0022B6E8E6|nr:helix-turn-helix transcriptional regulator [Rhizobium rhizogenes]MCZ7450820.1 helix-turn-helix transcriptional regulator [Rhizobium rhizogenes]
MAALTRISPEMLAKQIGQRVERLRLSRNITQGQLAVDAGISERTLRRLEAGDNPTLDTLLRVLTALKIEGNLDLLVPDSRVRPIERVRIQGMERQRSRPTSSQKPPKKWEWGEKE